MSSDNQMPARDAPGEQRDFSDQIQSALNLESDNGEKAAQFLDPDISLPRFLIGRNDESRALQRLIKVNGLIDDFSQSPVDDDGIPIVKSSDLPRGAWVVNCSTSISPVNVNRRLATLDVHTCLGIHDIIRASCGTLQWPWFVRDQRESIAARLQEWTQLYQRLADAESRSTLLDVVRYRLTADARYMQHYEVRIQQQYFEDFMAYSGEVFVDAGGYDGDTTEAFCRRHADYRRVYLFEPSGINMQAAKQRLSPFRDIEFKQIALSDKEEWLDFDAAAGSASAVSEGAAGQVRACRLDEVVDDDVSFIKMDLEGWEMKALAGAAHTIKSRRCKLAISVYHAASDFLDVPRFVLGLNPEYKLYLRHYTQGWSETILYFK